MEPETRDYMRDHLSARVYALRPRRINDDCYSDTFFSSIPSVRNYKCFQMFAFKHSSFEQIYLMQKEANAPAAYEDLVREVGAPNRMITDNAKVMTGD